MSENKNRSYLAMPVIGVAAFIIYCLFCPNDKLEAAKAVELIAIAFTAFAFLILFKNEGKTKAFLSAAVLFASPFYISFFVLYDRTIRQAENFWIEIMLITLMLCFVLIFIRHTAAAISAVSASCAVFVIMNELLLIFRKAAITPTDIFSFKTAVAVSGQYKFVFTYKMLIAVVSAAAALFVSLKFNIRLSIKERKMFSVVFTLVPLTVVVLGVVYVNNKEIKDIDQFDVSLSNKNAGTVTTFANGIKTMLVKPPEGYSDQKAEELLSAYKADNNTSFESPNVVVVMNEAFSDLSAFCGIGSAEEFMPNILAMNENVHKGYAHVSVFGGNTANTEFEFLTGNSLYFLPNGYIPYMRSITQKTPSIVDDFNALGYKTEAIHPYMPQCWRRSSVYPLFGFDEFISGPDFDPNSTTDTTKMRGSIDFGDLKYIRKYISDEEDLDKVFDELNKDPDTPKFIFNVTMQNHGPYTYKDEDFDEYLEKGGINIAEYEDSDEVMQYLTLVRESDKAFAEFTKKLKEIERPTVVVMFGDHLPGLKAVNESIKDKSAAEKQAKYIVPYIMWADFDIGYEENDEPIAMPYLSIELKKLINMPMTSWDVLREKTREDSPSLNAYGRFDKDGNWHAKDEGASEALKIYELVQYGHMFKGIDGK